MSQILESVILEQFQERLAMFKSKNMTREQKYQEWVLANGKMFTQVDEDLSKILWKKDGAMISQCYTNCWRSSYDQTMKYHIGWVASKRIPIPIEHAWLVKDGKVIDPTLVIPTDNESKRFGDEYFGVEIPKRFLNSFVLKQKFWWMLMTDYYLKQTGQSNRKRGRRS